MLDRSLNVIAKCLLLSAGMVFVAGASAAEDSDRQRELREKIASLSKQIEDHPRDFAALFNRAGAHEQCRNYDRAIEDYVRALNPRNDFSKLVGPREKYRSLAHLYLGQVFHFRKREFHKAVNNYTEALRLYPSTEKSVHYHRGRAFHALKQYGEAERDFAEALRRDPDDRNLLDSWAWQLATCPDDKYRDGERAVEFAVRANQAYGMKKPKHLEILAASYAENGDFDDAVEIQEKAISLQTEKDAEVSSSMDQRLRLYRAQKPFRDPNGRSPTD